MMKLLFSTFVFLFLYSQTALAACKKVPTIVTRHGLTAAQYQAAFNKYSGQKKLTLKDVTVANYKGKIRFSAIWEKRPYPFVASHGLSSAGYQNFFNKYTKLGYRLTDVSGYQSGNQVRYAAIFEKRRGPAWITKHGMTSAQYQAFFNSSTSKGYRLIMVDAFAYNNSARYSAIFEKSRGPAYVAKHGMTSAQYQAQFNLFARQGYGLKQVSGYSIGNSARFAAIWEKSTSAAGYHNLSSSGFQAKYTNLHYKGYRLKGLSSYAHGGKAKYVAVWKSFGAKRRTQRKIDAAMKAHMRQYNVPGISIAITKDECLVYASGYGYADTQRKIPANALSLFRVASVSKPITALAIYKLIEQGKINLEDHVFGPGNILGTSFGKWPYKTGITNVTVRHLLEHTSGWSNDGGDVMFKSEMKNHADALAFMLNKRGLKRTPGADDEYLNFGYLVLGRIIEKVSRTSYQSYLRNKIFLPLGIRTMFIGASKKAQSKRGEVTYYPASAYNLRPGYMDAHGGWIASAVDLARLMVRVDRLPRKRDILRASSIDSMLTASSTNNGYAKGFIVGSGAGHNGEMNGTGAFWWKTNDGYSWAILMNKRPSGDKGSFKARNTMNNLVKEITEWSEFDLF